MRLNIRPERTFPAAAAVALLFLLRGPNWFTVAVAFCIAAISAATDERRTSFILMAGVGLSMLIGSYSGATGLLTAGVMAAITISDSPITRGLLSVSMICLLLTGTLSGLLPLVLISVIAFSLRGRRIRAAAVVTGIIAMVFLAGIPQATTPAVSFHDEMLSGGHVIWPHERGIYLNCPTLVLEADGRYGSDLVIDCSAGGVRDTSPVGLIESGELTIPLYSGNTQVRIEDAEFPVKVILQRQWKPMNHPVIWVRNAMMES